MTGEKTPCAHPELVGGFCPACDKRASAIVEELRARVAELDIVRPVPDGLPGEIDLFADEHSHHYVPTSTFLDERQRREAAESALASLRTELEQARRELDIAATVAATRPDPMRAVGEIFDAVTAHQLRQQCASLRAERDGLVAELSAVATDNLRLLRERDDAKRREGAAIDWLKRLRRNASIAPQLPGDERWIANIDGILAAGAKP